VTILRFCSKEQRTTFIEPKWILGPPDKGMWGGSVVGVCHIRHEPPLKLEGVGGWCLQQENTYNK
jgi:hypothetical protein